MLRKAYNQLLAWKNSESRKPLLMLGARQVGKTWLMKEFGEKEYDNVIYINCDTEPLTKSLFLGDYNIDRLLLGFQAISQQPISPAKSLIILDEIQEAPRALHSLKYFCENAPEYHVMAAGSLLGVTLAQQESFPVGKVDMVHMYPMDFEEFLEAMGQSALCNLIRQKDFALITSFSPKLIEFLNQYYYCGGMPAVVKSFSEERDLQKVRQLQSTIISAYRADISKHATKTEAVRISLVLDSLPSQLSRENKKFIYGAAKKGGRAAEFELAIQWLIDAGLIYKVCRVSKIAMPLKFYEEISDFKLFFLDVGLLGCMSEIPADALLLDQSRLSEFKGMIAEEYTAQQLTAMGYSLYYWSNDRTPAEIDFVVQSGNEIIPIEVKSSTNVRGKSLSMILKENPAMHGLRFSLLDYVKHERLTNIPLYTLPFIEI